jgi:integrase
MSKKTWPKTKKTTNHGKPSFLVDARIAGKGERRFFSTRAEADTWAQLQRVRRQNQGGAAFDDSELAKFGLTIADAIRFTLEHHRRLNDSVTVPAALEQLVAAKKAAGMSSDYCRDIASRIGKLAAVTTDRTLAQLTTADLEGFLISLNVAPGTRNTIRRDVCTLWSFGEKHGWCLAKVARSTQKAKATAGAVEILTVEQMARLLEHSTIETLPGVVLAGFCALRQSELEKLDWAAVDLAERVVTVDASIAKTSARRTVAIPDNAVEWLRDHWKKSGAVMPTNYRPVFDRVRVRAGFVPTFPGRKDATLQLLLADAARAKVKLAAWPNNGLRHSAISYKLAQSRDIAHVATESGNSPAVIRSHYLELVKPSAAVAYFALSPSNPENVVGMPRKAAGRS